MNFTFLKLKSRVKGLFQSDISYIPLLEDGDSSKYFGTYSGQRYGQFDTFDCWDFSGVNVSETHLMIYWKLGLIPQDTKDWLVQNGYCDSMGEFDLSDRWIAILSGVRDNGNYQLNFWNLASELGLIPNKMLPYSATEAYRFTSKTDFNNDYFNPNVITDEMRNMGKEFLKRFTIQAEMLKGGYFNDIEVTLQTYLKEGSLQIGHPVPQDGSWNKTYVDMPVGRTVADHATELFKFIPESAYPYGDFDTYNPNPKYLSRNYYLPFITRVAIRPKPVAVPIQLPQFSSWMKFWLNVKAWIQGQPLPFPDVIIG